MDGGDQPSSLCSAPSIQMYPLPATDIQKQLPFPLLTGETVRQSGSSVDGFIVVTNYRLFLQNQDTQYHIPVGLIELVEIRELFYLHVCCKDARTYKCTFANNDNAMEWFNHIQKAAEPPRQLEQLFAFYYCIWSKAKGDEKVIVKLKEHKRYVFDKKMFDEEMYRMEFPGDCWRVSKVNEHYKLCPTYPPYFLVPACITDEMLEKVATFRSSRRIPAVVWRHTRNGAVIARCSQPEVGWLGWRSSEDEDLMRGLSEVVNFEIGRRTSEKESHLSHSPNSLNSDESLHITGDVSQHEKKVLIMDARSYTTAVANRARGGGCEYAEYYPNCEIQFMNLANIHSIRKSFHALRQLCTAADQPNWFSMLEGTRWLLHMSGLIKAAVTVATAIELDGRPVVVHCSDGWDRTPQIVALAELLLDPYYRTIDGFRVLIEREWLAFGHKFADRCGNSTGSDDQNERCPVFLQWLDCVHQLLVQFPCSFEFSQGYLIKLVQHTYSNLYGTFLCNSQKQRTRLVYGKTFAVWEFLEADCYKNHLYTAIGPAGISKVLWPNTTVRDLVLWSEVYLGTMEVNFSMERGSGSCPGPPDVLVHMAKTRSYGDLVNGELNGHQNHVNGRRNSDPVNHEIKIKPDTKRERLESDISMPDFLPSDYEDTVDCNQDCIFNGHNSIVSTSNLTNEQIDRLVQCENGYSESSSVAVSPPIDALLSGNMKTHADAGISQISDNVERVLFLANSRSSSEEEDIVINNSKCEVIHKTEQSVVERLRENNSNSNSDINSCSDNDEGNCDEILLRNELHLERSAQTSTETLVSETILCGTSPKEYNGFEKIQQPISRCIHSMEGCQSCTQITQTIRNGTHGNSNLTPTRYSHYSNISNSSNGWDNTLHNNYAQNRHCQNYQYPLGEDGLMPLRSPVHERLDQIFEEQRRKVELLEKELYASRQILIKQACHKCNGADTDKQDDTSSVVGSSCSASEGQASAGESLRSDLSWVAVEDGAISECQGTLWVPDHAVSRCTGCGTQFWLGRRRHHCRKCGKIFCADCSENSTPLPAEQLYNPVRVCTECFKELRRSCSDPPNQCKQQNGSANPPNTTQQITASSN